MDDKQPIPFVPNAKEAKTLKMVFEDLQDFTRAREKKYRLLGDRSPQRYWDEQEKRFVSYAPPKDVTEEDWQANIVMGITRNAVLAQVSKTGMKVPGCKIQSFLKEGFADDERSRIYQNLYQWSLQRESADKMQQYLSLGNFIRGNAAVYEGFEDKTVKVQIITDTDPETGEVKSEEKEERRWGPRRQIVPLNELFYPNFFANDIQDQPKCIWKQIVPYKVAEAEFGGMKNWKYVVPGKYQVGQENESFFYSRSQLSGKNVEIVRWYGNPWKGGKDRHVVVLNGIPVLDIPLPFNHKKLPFSWCKNNPFTDRFMLGMGVPFMCMENQDMSDAIINMALDKNLLSMQKPIMTDDPDPSIRTYLTPGTVMQFTKGSTYQLAPIEGVQPSELQMFNTVVQQAKEFSGAFGGGAAQTPRGGKVTARQAIMQEEQTKQLLGISMTNLEFLEKDVCSQRIANLVQFAPGSDTMVSVDSVDLKDGRKGRFVAFLVKNLKEAERMEYEDKSLTSVEFAGEMSGQPTEAVAITPDWFEFEDRIEAETVPESSYNASKSLEQAVATEDYTLLSQNPLVDQEELLRDLLKTKNKDPEKFIKKQAPQAPPGQEQGQGPPGGPPQAPQGPGPLQTAMAGGGQAKSLNALLGA